MEKKIVKDILFYLSNQPASQEDLYLVRDLQDTLLANRDTQLFSCHDWGAKRVIIFNLGLVPVVMFNLVLLSFEGILWGRRRLFVLVGVEINCQLWNHKACSIVTARQEQTITQTGFPASDLPAWAGLLLEGRII